MPARMSGQVSLPGALLGDADLRRWACRAGATGKEIAGKLLLEFPSHKWPRHTAAPSAAPAPAGPDEEEGKQSPVAVASSEVDVLRRALSQHEAALQLQQQREQEVRHGFASWVSAERDRLAGILAQQAQAEGLCMVSTPQCWLPLPTPIDWGHVKLGQPPG